MSISDLAELESYLANMRPVRGISLGERSAECVVHTLNFLDIQEHYPRLIDLAGRMGTTQSAIARMEKDLQEADLLRGTVRKKRRVAEHIVVNQSVACLLVLVVSRIREAVERSSQVLTIDSYQTMFKETFEEVRNQLGLDGTGRKYKALTLSPFLDAKGNFNFHKWLVEMFIYKKLIEIGHSEYDIQSRLLFRQRRSRIERVIGRFNAFGSILESDLQNRELVRPDSSDSRSEIKEIISMTCPFCGSETLIQSIDFYRESEHSRSEMGRAKGFYVAKCTPCRKEFEIQVTVLS